MTAILWWQIFILLLLGCSKILMKNQVTLSNNKHDITLINITIGPDQYNTAGGHWEPKNGKRFVWATIAINNRLKTEQRFFLDSIRLVADKKEIKPLIIDMDSTITMRAEKEPAMAPNETISRRLIYAVPESAVLEKILYGKEEIVITQD